MRKFSYPRHITAGRHGVGAILEGADLAYPIPHGPEGARVARKFLPKRFVPAAVLGSALAGMAIRKSRMKRGKVDDFIGDKHADMETLYKKAVFSPATMHLVTSPLPYFRVLPYVNAMSREIRGSGMSAAENLRDIAHIVSKNGIAGGVVAGSALRNAASYALADMASKHGGKPFKKLDTKDKIKAGALGAASTAGAYMLGSDIRGTLDILRQLSSRRLFMSKRDFQAASDALRLKRGRLVGTRPIDVALGLGAAAYTAGRNMRLWQDHTRMAREDSSRRRPGRKRRRK